MDPNVAAPAPAGEAAPSTPNPENAPSAPAEAPTLTPEQVATYLGTTPEMLEQYKTFTDNNGGFDKTFTNVKKALAARQTDQNSTPTPAPQTPGQPLAPHPSPAPEPEIPGGFSTQEFITQQYFESLAKQDKYAGIAEDIRSGTVLKEMAKFGIKATIGNQFNNQQVTDFLDLYSKTRPAPSPSTPLTTTPTVEYVQVPNDTISNMQQAQAILQQDHQLRAEGKEGHPLAKAANEFFDNVLNANQNRGKREHKTLDPKNK